MTESDPQQPPVSGVDDISPLRALVFEFHEVYEELLYAGFTQQEAARILSHMLTEAVLYRSVYEEDEEDDEYNDDEE